VNRDQKAAVVEEIAGQIRDAQAIFAVDYRGVSVTQAAELRTRLDEAGATFRVVKNTLTERAADSAGAEPLKELLEGPTAFTFVQGDAALAAKALAQFRRQNEVLEFKGGTLEGRSLSIEEIESIARLPALDILRGQFVGLLASPISGLVRGLNGLLSGVAVALGQIQEKGLIGGDAPEAEAPAPEPEEPEPAAAAEPAPDQPEEAPSEAPGDPVAEAEAAEEETSDTPDEGGDAPAGEEQDKES
jgi:large subunit ribosomal protein L10